MDPVNHLMSPRGDTALMTGFRGGLRADGLSLSVLLTSDGLHSVLWGDTGTSSKTMRLWRAGAMSSLYLSGKTSD